ncbi:MAG: glutathione peroxidase [Flavobacteriaceae bacterium]
MYQFKFLLLVCFCTLACGQKENFTNKTIYQFQVKDIEGEIFDFKDLKGKKVMIVNTASKCGYTHQYEKLQRVYETYKDQDFVIIGFPANNFMWQEPNSDTEISAFCQKNYGVTFPMMSKISVKGRNQHPIYAFLTAKTRNGVMDSKVRWNFQKYLIGSDGQLDQVIEPRTEPNAPEIIEWIEG